MPQDEVHGALFVEANETESVRLALEGIGDGEGVFGLGVASGHGVRRVFGERESEAVGDGGAGLVQAPVAFSDGPGELDFFEAFGVESGCELPAEFFGGDALLVRKDCDLGGDFVAPGVETGFGFACFGLRTGGFLRVAAVGFDGALGEDTLRA